MRKEKALELQSKIDFFRIRKLSLSKEDARFLKGVSYQVVLENGTTFTREKLLKNGSSGGAVITFALTDQDEVILVVEPRVFTKEGVGVGLPAGYVEESLGETPIDAARRELLEETGYSPRQIQVLGSFYQDEGCSSALNYGVLALGCRKVKEQHLDPDEHIEVFLCSLSEAYELLENNWIRGANSCLTMMKAKEYLKK